MLEGLLGLVGSPSLLVELVQQLGQAGVHEVPLVATQHHWKLGDVALVVVGSGWFGGGHIRPLLALDDRRRTGSPGYRGLRGWHALASLLRPPVGSLCPTVSRSWGIG